MRELFDKIRLAVENQRLTALLVAILVHQGRITLPKEVVEAEFDAHTLKSETHADGSMTLWVERRH